MSNKTIYCVYRFSQNVIDFGYSTPWCTKIAIRIFGKKIKISDGCVVCVFRKYRNRLYYVDSYQIT